MIKVGLTGGIGCGKSYVADLLRRRHIPVYDTDKEAKRLMMESATIRRGLVDWVGERAYMPDGTLNRERIASYLFASPLHAERINGLYIRWCRMISCNGWISRTDRWSLWNVPFFTSPVSTVWWMKSCWYVLRKEFAWSVS